MADEERRLRSVPARGAKMESDGIVIEWDVPKAPGIKWKPNNSNWYRRLAPMKSTPNRSARVVRDVESMNKVRARADNIRKSLRERDPRSKWKISYGKADDGTWGIWVTYLGVMSDAEYEEAQALYQYRARRSRLARINKERKQNLHRSLTNPSLKPPVVTMDELEERARRIAESKP